MLRAEIYTEEDFHHRRFDLFVLKGDGYWRIFDPRFINEDGSCHQVRRETFDQVAREYRIIARAAIEAEIEAMRPVTS